MTSASPRADRPNVLPVIALTGCDGSGKSTLASALVSRLRERATIEQLYLGQSSGKIGDWIADLPLVGPPLLRYLARKSDRVHERPAEPPGGMTASAIYLLSRWRVHKFRRMLAMCRRGALVVTDRYPQAEIPGFLYDGPELAKTQGGSWWVRWLRGRELAHYRWMAGQVPMLVIRLNVDEATAHARKPDHKLASLRKKIAALPQLTFNGARILDLDGREEADRVLDTSLRAVHGALEATPA